MAENCWVLTHDGEDHEHDAIVHFSIEDQAVDHANWAKIPHRPRQLDAPCQSVSCSCCAYAFDEDEDGVVHFASEAEIDEVLTDHGWKRDGDDRRCPYCVTGPCDQEADTHG